MSDVSSKMSSPLSSSLSPFPLTLSRYRWYVNALSNFFWNRESLKGFPCLSRRCSGEGTTIYLELRYHDHTIEIHWTILYIQQIIQGDIKCCSNAIVPFWGCHLEQPWLSTPSWSRWCGALVGLRKNRVMASETSHLSGNRLLSWQLPSQKRRYKDPRGWKTIGGSMVYASFQEFS